MDLSFPIRLRWALARDSRLLSEVLDLFLRSLFTGLRRRARELDIRARECGAVTFIQRFGPVIQLNVYFHVRVAEGVFDGVGSLVPLPPPDDAEMQRVLELFLQRLRHLLEARGLFELDDLPEDALDSLRPESAQWRLPLSREGAAIRTGGAHPRLPRSPGE